MENMSRPQLTLNVDDRAALNGLIRSRYLGLNSFLKAYDYAWRRLRYGDSNVSAAKVGEYLGGKATMPLRCAETILKIFGNDASELGFLREFVERVRERKASGLEAAK